MNLRTPTATLAIGTITLLVLSVAGWFLLIGPVMQQIGETSEARESAQDRNQIMSLQLASLRKKVEELPQTEEAADRLADVFPPTANQPGFFADVNAAARAAKIPPNRVTTLSPSAPVLPEAPQAPAPTPDAEGNTPATPAAPDAPSVAVQNVAINAEGNYNQVSQFLEALERMDRALLIQSVDIQTQDTKLLLTVSGLTFVAEPITVPDTEAGRTSS